MLKIKVRDGKITIKNKRLEITKNKEMEFSYNAGGLLLTASGCQDGIYYLDACYCKEKDKVKIYIKTNCDKFETFLDINESASFRGLSFKLTGIDNKDYECF